MLGAREIKKRFGTTAKPPVGTETPHDQLRETFIELASVLDLMVPEEGRTKSLAFTALEEASMWAHKAVAQALTDQEELKKQFAAGLPVIDGTNNG